MKFEQHLMSRSGPWLLAFVTIMLALLSTAYLARGFYVTLCNGTCSGDLERRWIEQQYIFGGRNPYDVAFEQRALNLGQPAPACQRESSVLAEIGVPWDVDYPPWAYFSGYAFFWPNRELTPWWFAACQIASLLLILRWTYHSVAPGSASPSRATSRLFVVFGIASFGSICTTIGTGNYGVIVLAMLVCSLAFWENNRRVMCGLLLGLALLKPNLAGPFVLIPLMSGEFIVLSATVTYVAVACLVVWRATNTNPVEMTLQMLQAAAHFVREGYSLLNVPLTLGVPYRLSVIISACTVTAFCALLLRRHRRSPLLIQYAIASVAARLWTYNLSHSNLILFFLFVALFRQVILTRTAASVAICLLVGISLWLPAKLSDFLMVQFAQVTIWIAGITYLLSMNGERQFRATAPAIENRRQRP